MKKEIVLVLIMLISFPVMADELVELQSVDQTTNGLTSTKAHTLQELISTGRIRQRPLPEGLFKDYQKGKFEYQSVTVLKSTIPEIPKGSMFKSNSHGILFFFNGFWLVLNSVSDFVPNEFGEIVQKDSYQWTLSNVTYGYDYIFGSSISSSISSIRTDGVTISEMHHEISPVVINCTSERYPVNEPLVYPLRLTNDLYVIEFAAPQELADPKKEN